MMTTTVYIHDIGIAGLSTFQNKQKGGCKLLSVIGKSLIIGHSIFEQ